MQLSEENYAHTFSRNKDDGFCFSLEKNKNEWVLNSGYYVGLTWLDKNKHALLINPKLNNKNLLEPDKIQIDYYKMLFSCLQHPEVANEIEELFEIKWDEPTISIENKEDVLTPFLIIQFLSLVKSIVRKGLKKSYYKVEKNLNSKVKGKVLIGSTIKHNLLKNKFLNTYCKYEEFGVNGLENRLLKKTLHFINKYLPTRLKQNQFHYFEETLNYISPAFENVTDKIDLRELKFTKNNAFFKEYDKAIRLAKIILKRFSYNISNAVNEKIETHPFWIDMSKLFELYTLGLLKDRFGKDVKYHFTHYGNELDYILKSGELKMVIDAKYKQYQKYKVANEDVRQVSGYARLEKVYDYLEKTYPDSINCLIIYPDIINGFDNLKSIQFENHPVKDYNGVFKLGVKLPLLN
ncbi:MAG: restriction endonuclease [Ignavibacteriae bacterium]|nr:restriction endonuclease [Ignavibacteriota bacterium]